MIKHTILGCALSVFLLPFSFSAHAEYKANTFGADKRIQYFKYTPDDVFVIKTKIGRSTLIQFEDGETITDDGGLGMGEAKAWSLAVKGSNIFFKPVRQLPDTNMVVVTNKRTYSFELKLSNTDNDVTYVARFDYPSENKPLPTEVAKPKKVYLRSIENKDGGETIYIDSRINVHYYRMGDAIIAPTNAWDDNLFTYLKYDNAKDLPTVYRVLPDGSETLVNSHTKDNLLVIHEVADKLRLRLGSLVVDLHNANKQQSTFNYQATSEDNLIRLVK